MTSSDRRHLSPLPDLPVPLRCAATGADSAEANALRRRLRAGELLRLRDGAFVETAVWDDLTPRKRHLVRILAAKPRLHNRYAVSHRSAAAMHDLPTIGDWPDDVHLTDPERVRGRRWSGVVLHPGPLRACDRARIGGIAVTSVDRTCVDAALGWELRDAVALVDGALHERRTSIRRLEALLETMDRVRGAAGARLVFAFADGRAQRAGESATRVVLRLLGAPRPVLQQPFYDERGLIGYVDFWWPEFGVVLEFDGDVKYTNPRFRNGRSAAEIALAERKREKRLQRMPAVREVVRADWSDVAAEEPLARMLMRAGLPLGVFPRI